MNLAPARPELRRRPTSLLVRLTHFAYRAGAFSNAALHPAEQKYQVFPPYVAVYFAVLSSTVIPQIGSFAIVELDLTRRGRIAASTRAFAQGREGRTRPALKPLCSRTETHGRENTPLRTGVARLG